MPSTPPPDEELASAVGTEFAEQLGDAFILLAAGQLGVLLESAGRALESNPHSVVEVSAVRDQLGDQLVARVHDRFDGLESQNPLR